MQAPATSTTLSSWPNVTVRSTACTSVVACKAMQAMSMARAVQESRLRAMGSRTRVLILAEAVITSSNNTRPKATMV